jgi:hypothetical protein
VARVQTRDLRAPDRLEVAPLKRDTFVRAAPPPLDPGRGSLERGLAAFASGISSLAKRAEAEHKKSATEARSAEYEKWRASTSDVEQVRQIKEGVVPYYADPYIGAAVRKDYGGLRARVLANEIQNELDAGKLPIGREDFNPEKYVLEKSQGIIEEIGGSYEAISSFRRGIDSIRRGLRGQHHKARAEAFRVRSENIAVNNLEQAIDTGARQAMSGQQISDSLRSIYAELGPRVGGGVFDMQYQRVDELLLGVLEKRADDPAYAEQVIGILNADRKDMGNGFRMGPLSATAKYGKRARSIIQRAEKAIHKQRIAEAEGRIADGMMKSLEAGDGRFASIEHSPAGQQLKKAGGRSFKTIKDEVFNAKIGQIRADNGGAMDLPKEAELVFKNGIDHPELTGMLEAARAGYLNYNYNKGGKDDPQMSSQQAQNIMKAAQVFNYLQDNNASWVQEFVNKDTRDFFRTYTAIRTKLGMDPMTAAATTAQLYSRDGDLDPPSFNAAANKALDAALDNIDTRPGEGGGILNWFSDEIRNPAQVRKEIKEIAITSAMVKGIKVEDAIEEAREMYEKNVINVNGWHIFGARGLEPGDATHFRGFIGAAYKKYKDNFDTLGLDEKDIAFKKVGPGRFIMIDARNGAAVSIYTEKGVIQPQISYQDIITARKEGEDNRIKKKIDEMVNKRKEEEAIQETPSPNDIRSERRKAKARNK